MTSQAVQEVKPTQGEDWTGIGLFYRTDSGLTDPETGKEFPSLQAALSCIEARTSEGKLGRTAASLLSKIARDLYPSPSVEDEEFYYWRLYEEGE